MEKLKPTLVRQADVLCEGASLLCVINDAEAASWKSIFTEIRAKEHLGDALLTEFREISAKCYLQPGVRRELSAVAMAIDDAVDVIKDSANALTIYSPSKIDEPLKNLVRIVHEQAVAIAAIIPHMERIKGDATEIIHQADRITELERDADEVYEQYIGYIFANEPDLREMTKYKNLAELYEKATDSCKHVADCVRILLMRFVH